MSERLKDKVVLITGASRGIGREIALRCAKEGAKIGIAAKTVTPHPKLSGTILSVAEEVKAAGGEALPLQLDVREEAQVQEAIEKLVKAYGKIDILINNASAIDLSSSTDITMKRYDLISAVNVRATFLCSRACLPYLKNADNPHILNLSPPLNMDAKWFKTHLAYTMSKFGMSMCTLGMAEEFKEHGIAVNSLWPKTLIATAAIEFNFPKELLAASRKPAIVADAALEIITSDSKSLTGQFLIDEEFLQSKGVQDFTKYAMHAGAPLYPDLFL